MEEQKSGQESGKQGQKPHKRRKRYSGTHPKKYEEKYKELNPEKFLFVPVLQDYAMELWLCRK